VDAIALDHCAVPVKDATPAKLMGDPKLTVELSEQELKEALRKSAQREARKSNKHTRSTS
jgi:hypothetical protein